MGVTWSFAAPSVTACVPSSRAWLVRLPWLAVIVIAAADHGTGVARGTEGAQECDVLLQFVQGRADGKGLLDLACIPVPGSHGHHLRGIERVRERGPPSPGRVAEP